MMSSTTIECGHVDECEAYAGSYDWDKSFHNFYNTPWADLGFDFSVIEKACSGHNSSILAVPKEKKNQKKLKNAKTGAKTSQGEVHDQALKKAAGGVLQAKLENAWEKTTTTRLKNILKAATVSDERKEEVKQAVAELTKSGAIPKSWKLGDKIPELEKPAGKNTKPGEDVAKKDDPVVVVDVNKDALKSTEGEDPSKKKIEEVKGESSGILFGRGGPTKYRTGNRMFRIRGIMF